MVIRRFGDPRELRLEDVADPQAGPGDVRIAVHAAGVNPVDAGNRRDGSWAGIELPAVLGYDVAGVVDDVGPGVANVAVGDHVMAMTGFPGGAGGYAEMVVTPAALVAVLEPPVDLVEAAAIPLAGGTALDVLARLGVPRGGTMLVLGASGGVGMFVVQLAVLDGLQVIAVGRDASHARLHEHGATACIDYTSEDVPGRARTIANGPVDAIADLVGGDLLARSLPALRTGGSMASIATPELDLDPILDNNLTWHGVLIGDDGDRTRRLARSLAVGDVRPHVSHVLPLADAAEAHRIVESGHPDGKIVLATHP